MPRITALKQNYIGKIVAKWLIDADLTAQDLADKMNLCRASIYYKMSNNAFSYEDLLDVIEICNPSDEEIVRCFRR